jgi:hypothetical protein
MFHPLAYLIKLNIEMSMARLIKKIALGSNNAATAAGFRSFEDSSHAHKTLESGNGLKSWAERQSNSIKTIFGAGQNKSVPSDGGIKKTEEFTVRSVPADELEMQPQKSSTEKNVHVGISALPSTEGRNEFRESKDVKAIRQRQYMSDEETLIKPQPALLPHRRSEDSSGTRSEASDMR